MVCANKYMWVFFMFLATKIAYIVAQTADNSKIYEYSNSDQATAGHSSHC